MSVSARLAGLHAGPVEALVDERWLMAYAASVGQVGPTYLDTARPGGIVAHPLFPVCLEWPAILALGRVVREAGLEPTGGGAAIHATHDCRLLAPLVPGGRYSTRLEVVGVEQRRPGVLLTLRMTTTAESGAPVAETLQGTLYLGQELEGEPVVAPPCLERRTPLELAAEVPLEVPAGAAHAYTEGARIYNPIHTSRRVALEAGLPGILLHGTATLAMAVGTLCEQLGAEPTAVRQVAGRFCGVVPLPSTLSLRFEAPSVLDGARVVGFEVVDATGAAVLDRAVLRLG